MKTDWNNYTINYNDVIYGLHYRDNINLTACESYIPNSPSPEYPSLIKSVNGNLTISNQTEIKQTIAIPTLDKIGDVADSYNIVTGELTQRIGVIASYNGETIETDYISSTGGLDIGSTIKYVLTTPITTYLTPTPIPTYYPTITISTDGTVKGNITATLKVSKLN